MFDAVLSRHARAPRRWGRGAVATIVLHTLALGGFVLASLHGGHGKGTSAAEVTFFAAPPPPPPPPPPAGGGAKTAPKTEKPKVQKKPDQFVEPKKTVEKQPEPEKPKDEPKTEGGQEGGQVGGQVGGTVGGQVGGQIGGQLDGQLGGQVGGGRTSVIPFGAGMERPRMVSGTKEVVWTKEAKAAGSGGTAILKCVITTEGAITNCRIIKGIAHMDQAILAMVSSWRYTPVMFQGRPVAVDYTFTIPLRSVD